MAAASTLARIGWIRAWSPPVRRREFWIVQALVLAIALGHGLNEWATVVELHGAEFLPVSLYLLPVVYAALTFGMRGAAPTALWSFGLTLPNILLWHQGLGALGELWQAALVVAVGLFVGRRVDCERQARRQAETRERERRESEDRYRGLFDVAADGILLLDQSGRVLEANAAALRLLGTPHDLLRGQRLERLLPELWEAISTGPDEARSGICIHGANGQRWVQPITVQFSDADGASRLLLELRDVTLALERQHLLESFARRTVAAREEERRRVARDLHDGPLQSLMLLWRSLDAIKQFGDPGLEGLAEARHRAEDVADELRQFSRDLRPSVLDDLGLAAALKAEAMQLANRSGLDVSFDLAGTARRLPIEVELTLLRICQEALRNIERHSGARHAAVRFELEPHGYKLEITDDGLGVRALPPPAQLVAAGRLGIVGMQERARLVDATCAVRPASGAGTVVEVIGREAAPTRPNALATPVSA